MSPLPVACCVAAWYVQHMRGFEATWVDAGTWRKVHNLWISEIYHSLKPQVAGRLALSIDEEVTLVEIEGPPDRRRPDLYLSETPGTRRQQPEHPRTASGAVAYAEGVEEVSTESRHYLVVHDLRGSRVVGVLEILSPTNKGYYSQRDLELFKERRAHLLASPISYVEVDAVGVGKRWLPRCLEELRSRAGVVWSSTCRKEGRLFQGWAWEMAGPLPRVPWDLVEHGTLDLDLDRTLREAMGAAGIRSEP